RDQLQDLCHAEALRRQSLERETGGLAFCVESGDPLLDGCEPAGISRHEPTISFGESTTPLELPRELARGIALSRSEDPLRPPREIEDLLPLRLQCQAGQTLFEALRELSHGIRRRLAVGLERNRGHRDRLSEGKKHGAAETLLPGVVEPGGNEREGGAGESGRPEGDSRGARLQPAQLWIVV